MRWSSAPAGWAMAASRPRTSPSGPGPGPGPGFSPEPGRGQRRVPSSPATATAGGREQLSGGRDGELPALGPAVPFDGKERPGPAELGRVAKGGHVGADRQVGGYRAPAERGEHRHHPLDAVRHEDEDDVARPDPLLRELGAEPAGFAPELFAAETAPPVVVHRERRRPLPHEALEAVGERLARPPATLAVAARALRGPLRHRPPIRRAHSLRSRGGSLPHLPCRTSGSRRATAGQGRRSEEEFILGAHMGKVNLETLGGWTLRA